MLNDAKRKMAKAELIFKDEAYAIMGACFAVYRDKGCGFLEAVYQECLEIEFEHCDIPAKAKQPLFLTYRGRTLQQMYQPDFICHPSRTGFVFSALFGERTNELLTFINNVLTDLNLTDVETGYKSCAG